MLPGMNGFQKPARDSNPESPDDSARDDATEAEFKLYKVMY
jgi:hypothetical protein